MLNTLDLTGLSIEAAMDVAARDMDAAVAEALDHCASFLLAIGSPADYELAAFSRNEKRGTCRMAREIACRPCRLAATGRRNAKLACARRLPVRAAKAGRQFSVPAGRP
jgi:hypothetical protein